eukprot:g288.t1
MRSKTEGSLEVKIRTARAGKKDETDDRLMPLPLMSPGGHTGPGPRRRSRTEGLVEAKIDAARASKELQHELENELAETAADADAHFHRGRKGLGGQRRNRPRRSVPTLPHLDISMGQQKRRYSRTSKEGRAQALSQLGAKRRPSAASTKERRISGTDAGGPAASNKSSDPTFGAASRRVSVGAVAGAGAGAGARLGISADVRDEELRAHNAGRQRQRQVQRLQRCWLRAMATATGAVGMRARRDAARAAAQQQNAQHAQRLQALSRSWSDLIGPVLWMLRLQLRARARARASERARLFLRGRPTQVLKFQRAARRLQRAVVVAQVVARQWLACQAARRRALRALWRRHGEALMDDVIERRQAEHAARVEVRAREQREGGRPSGAAPPAGSFKEKRAYAGLDQRLADASASVVTPKHARRDRISDALRGAQRNIQKRMVRSVFRATAETRDAWLASTVRQLRKAHVAAHRAPHAARKQAHRDHAAMAAIVADSMRAAVEAPAWPVLLLYGPLLRDEGLGFRDKVRQVVVQAMDEYERDHFDVTQQSASVLDVIAVDVTK